MNKMDSFLKNYKLIKDKHNGIKIYSNNKTVIRIGCKENIYRIVKNHKLLIKFGYPVSKLIEYGKLEDNLYFHKEKYFGDHHFGQIFRNDQKSIDRKISILNFNKFIRTSKKYALVQQKNLVTFNFKKFLNEVKFDKIESFSLNKELNLRVMKKIRSDFFGYKAVISLCDFDPYNIFPKGIIDFEDIFFAPIGFDLIRNITSFSYFPRHGCEIEAIRGYELSNTNIRRYISILEKTTKINLKKIMNATIVLSILLYAQNMKYLKKLTKHRKILIPKILERYVDGKDILNFLINEGEIKIKSHYNI